MSLDANPENQPYVDVPDRALTACPKQRFALVRVGLTCLGCESFAGLEDRFPGMSQHAFESRFSVRCFGEPVKRAIVRLVEA